MTENESKILNFLIEDPSYSYQDLSTKVGISRKTIAQNIKTLKEKGIIRRIGSDIKGYWEINE